MTREELLEQCPEEFRETLTDTLDDIYEKFSAIDKCMSDLGNSKASDFYGYANEIGDTFKKIQDICSDAGDSL